MVSLALHGEHTVPETDDAPAGTGRIQHGEQLAWIVTPPTIEPGRAYPLVVVLHGAGRQDEMIVKGLQAERERTEAIFVVPRSLGMTWDLIEGTDGPDLRFLDGVLHSLYRRYRIDPAKRDAFARYARAWVELTNRHGGTHHGFYVAAELNDRPALYRCSADPQRCLPEHRFLLARRAGAQRLPCDHQNLL